MIADLTNTTRTYNIDGVAVEFSRIDCYDLGKIDEVRKARAKASATENIKSTPGSTVGMLVDIKNDIDARSYTIHELYQYTMTPQGSCDVLQRSLVKSGKKADEAKELIGKLDGEEVSELAVSLVVHKKMYANEKRFAEEAKIVSAEDAADKLLEDDAGPNEQGASAPSLQVSPATEPALTMKSEEVVNGVKKTPTLAFGE